MGNVEVAKTLKEPENLMELKTYFSYMKDKSGISGWEEKQELVQVREANVDSDSLITKGSLILFFRINCMRKKLKLIKQTRI